MRWIVVSVVLSIVLTVLLNAALRTFPGAERRLARLLTESESTDPEDRRVRVIAPWKAMIVLSIVLTVVLNVLLWVV